MRVVTIGGGPAGLYLAILLERADPANEVVVLERNGPDDTFGWGVVFSDATLDALRRADPESFAEIARAFVHWDDIDVVVRGTRITSGGHGFAGIGRRRLLDILQRRARALGADLRFGVDVPDAAALPALGLGQADLVVAADGVNSAIRQRHAAWFAPDLEEGRSRFVWLGTTRPFDAFTFLFVETEHGVFQAHCYRFDERTSTFIVECDEASWRAAGLDRLDADATVRACERLFAEHLGGHHLLHNATHRRDSPWTRFTRVRCARWFHERLVLMGDAAHTAHFSVGSGTKLAMEDAIGLASSLGERAELPAALAAYQDERMTEALRLQNAARNSMEWFEHVRRYLALAPEQFAYSLLTRSQRVGHESLRVRDARYLDGVERWFARRAGHAPPRAPARRASRRAAPADASGNGTRPPPPMFTPFRLRGLELPNRVVVAPMDMYSATDGVPNEFHMVHLGARALGGAGLVVTEMACVSPEGRITPGCTGMYTAEQRDAWRRIVQFVHRWTPARICLQLGHSGRKGSTKLMWEGMDEPLPEGNWEVVGPSAVPYGEGSHVPRAMDRADMIRVRDAFVHSTRLALAAGFDMLELHCAHGYLLSSFLTPLSNQRADAWGGSLENRLRFPLEVFAAMRAEWPGERPMSVRLSATDWRDDGLPPEEAVDIARAFAAAGADVIHVSTGQTTAEAKPVYGRLFQTPFSDMIRNEAGVPTIAVGNVTEADQVNAIVAAGRADLVALARPHLADPQWTLRAAAELGFEAQPWPVQYLSGRTQLARTLQRRAEQSAAANRA